jgi:hypothetical protein
VGHPRGRPPGGGPEARSGASSASAGTARRRPLSARPGSTCCWTGCDLPLVRLTFRNLRGTTDPDGPPPAAPVPEDARLRPRPPGPAGAAGRRAFESQPFLGNRHRSSGLPLARSFAQSAGCCLDPRREAMRAPAAAPRSGPLRDPRCRRVFANRGPALSPLLVRCPSYSYSKHVQSFKGTL